MTFDINWGGGSYPTYDGEMKGSDSAKSVRDAEFKMQKTAFDKQMATIDKLLAAFGKDLSGKEGFDPALKASMRSQFLNSNDSTFNQAGDLVRENLGKTGNTGGDPGGGDVTRLLSRLFGAKASSQSGGLLDINIKDAMQAITNKFNAGSILSGNAATLTGPQSIGESGTLSALREQLNADNSGFGASFLSSFGTTLGHTAGGGNARPGAGWFGMGG